MVPQLLTLNPLLLFSNPLSALLPHLILLRPYFKHFDGFPVLLE